MPLCLKRRGHTTGQCLWIAAAMSRYPEYNMFGLECLRVPMECMECTCLTKEDEGKKCEHCTLDCYCSRRQFVVREETVSSCTVQGETCEETSKEN
jgi:hypothetical protein